MLDQIVLKATFVLVFISFYVFAFLIFTQYRWIILAYALWTFIDRNTKDQVFLNLKFLCGYRDIFLLFRIVIYFLNTS